MAEFVFAAKTDEIPAGRGKTVSLGDKRIALFNVDGAFYAIDDTCLHRGRSPGRGRAGRLPGNLPMAWLEVRCPERRDDHERRRSCELLPNPCRIRRCTGLLLRSDVGVTGVATAAFPPDGFRNHEPRRPRNNSTWHRATPRLCGLTRIALNSASRKQT